MAGTPQRRVATVDCAVMNRLTMPYPRLKYLSALARARKGFVASINSMKKAPGPVWLISQSYVRAVRALEDETPQRLLVS